MVQSKDVIKTQAVITSSTRHVPLVTVGTSKSRYRQWLRNCGVEGAMATLHDAWKHNTGNQSDKDHSGVRARVPPTAVTVESTVALFNFNRPPPLLALRAPPVAAMAPPSPCGLAALWPEAAASCQL